MWGLQGGPDFNSRPVWSERQFWLTHVAWQYQFARRSCIVSFSPWYFACKSNENHFIYLYDLGFKRNQYSACTALVARTCHCETIDYILEWVSLWHWNAKNQIKLPCLVTDQIGLSQSAFLLFLMFLSFSPRCLNTWKGSGSGYLFEDTLESDLCELGLDNYPSIHIASMALAKDMSQTHSC